MDSNLKKMIRECIVKTLLEADFYTPKADTDPNRRSPLETPEVEKSVSDLSGAGHESPLIKKDESEDSDTGIRRAAQHYGARDLARRGRVNADGTLATGIGAAQVGTSAKQGAFDPKPRKAAVDKPGTPDWRDFIKNRGKAPLKMLPEPPPEEPKKAPKTKKVDELSPETYRNYMNIRHIQPIGYDKKSYSGTKAKLSSLSPSLAKSNQSSTGEKFVDKYGDAYPEGTPHFNPEFQKAVDAFKKADRGASNAEMLHLRKTGKSVYDKNNESKMKVNELSPETYQDYITARSHELADDPDNWGTDSYDLGGGNSEEAPSFNPSELDHAGLSNASQLLKKKGVTPKYPEYDYTQHPHYSSPEDAAYEKARQRDPNSHLWDVAEAVNEAKKIKAMHEMKPAKVTKRPPEAPAVKNVVKPDNMNLEGKSTKVTVPNPNKPQKGRLDAPPTKVIPNKKKESKKGKVKHKKPIGWDD